MRTPKAAELLNVWENGLRQSSIERALALLKIVYPEQSLETLAELNIGERDTQLFQLRQLLFGPSMTNTTCCPSCSERLEWEMNIEQLCVNGGNVSTKELCVDMEPFRIKFRLPNSGDLMSLNTALNEKNEIRKRLLARCLLEITTTDGEMLQMEVLPESTLQQIIEEMERADPQSNLRINLTCPTCNHRWEGVFDIVSFLWTEVHYWAQRTLRVVHILARAYGWSEKDILSMSPTRRQVYLEMASQ